MTLKTQWVGLTEVGLIRDHNEDSFFIDEARNTGMVADGMGGHELGEVASALATEAAQAALAAGREPAEALLKAHAAILKHPKSGGKKSMGTTGVLVRLQGGQADIAWVGDSRAYLFDGENLYPLTKDHTPVQEMVNAGQLSAEGARTHPNRNRVNQALGIQSSSCPIKPGTQKAYFGIGSVILLCSDGLTEHVSDAMLLQIFRAGTRHLEVTARRLMDAALDDGGSDNITVVLVKCLDS